jgi:hypothetical protein
MTSVDALTGSGDWRKWSPGLDNDALTLQQVYDTLPGNDPDQIDQMVRLIENPASPYALPGAIGLQHHDCIHILLGRGLLNQDEAFVIGFTMGTAKDAIDAEQVQLFRLAAKHLYKPPYRMTDDDLVAYDLGFAYGARPTVGEAYSYPFDAAWQTMLGALRHELGIDGAELRRAYRKERRRLPNSTASRRLPV